LEIPNSITSPLCPWSQPVVWHWLWHFPATLPALLELREAYNAQLPKLSEFSTWVGQNVDLYNAYQQLADGDDFGQLDTAQQKVITNALRDFKLSGVALPENKKQRYGELKKRLSEVTSKYSDNGFPVKDLAIFQKRLNTCPIIAQ
jgi:Zn-dependent oligopeptidase